MLGGIFTDIHLHQDRVVRFPFFGAYSIKDLHQLGAIHRLDAIKGTHRQPDFVALQGTD